MNACWLVIELLNQELFWLEKIGIEELVSNIMKVNNIKVFIPKGFVILFSG